MLEAKATSVVCWSLGARLPSTRITNKILTVVVCAALEARGSVRGLEQPITRGVQFGGVQRRELRKILISQDGETTFVGALCVVGLSF